MLRHKPELRNSQRPSHNNVPEGCSGCHAQAALQPLQLAVLAEGFAAALIVTARLHDHHCMCRVEACCRADVCHMHGMALASMRTCKCPETTAEPILLKCMHRRCTIISTTSPLSCSCKI